MEGEGQNAEIGIDADEVNNNCPGEVTTCAGAENDTSPSMHNQLVLGEKALSKHHTKIEIIRKN